MTETFPDVFSGKPPYYNGFENKDDPAAVEYVRLFNEAVRQLREGKLYVRFKSGDRAGSIARLTPDIKGYEKNAAKDIEILHCTIYRFNPKATYDFSSSYVYAVCNWDGRKNKVKLYLPHPEVEILLNYDGPTFWAKFDAKSAKEKALQNPEQYDIDGNLLNINDKVLYINARYGSGMELCHGVIKEFTASVDSKRTEIFTIVRSDESTDEREILSKISNPSCMIYKEKQ